MFLECNGRRKLFIKKQIVVVVVYERPQKSVTNTNDLMTQSLVVLNCAKRLCDCQV